MDHISVNGLDEDRENQCREKKACNSATTGLVAATRSLHYRHTQYSNENDYNCAHFYTLVRVR